jgi:hypothetical protein
MAKVDPRAKSHRSDRGRLMRQSGMTYLRIVTPLYIIGGA